MKQQNMKDGGRGENDISLLSFQRRDTYPVMTRSQNSKSVADIVISRPTLAIILLLIVGSETAGAAN